MKKLVKNKVLALLAISLFGLFMVGNALAMSNMTTSDCPMKVHCAVCTAPASMDAQDVDSILPFLHIVEISLPQLESITLDSLYHPPKI